MSKLPDSLSVRRRIEKRDIPPVWLWSGPEAYLKEELYAKVAAQVIDEGTASFNQNRYRGGDEELDRILGTCRTLPMMGSHRLVFLQDIEALGRTERPALEAYVASPSPETVLILAGERTPTDPFHKRLTAAGADPAVFWIPFPDQAVKWIQIRFRDLGLSCDTQAAEALYDACGGGLEDRVSLSAIAPELEKVALNAADRSRVGVDDLAVVGRKADEKLLYEISSRVAHRDLPGALRALDGALLFKDNSEIRIVATLTHRLLDVAKVRDLLDSGLPSQEARRIAGVWPQAWPDVEAGVRCFDRAAIESSLAALTHADRTLKSSSRRARGVLEHALSVVCGAV